MGLDSRRESVRMILHLLSLLLGALYGIRCFWRGLCSLHHHHPLLPISLFLVPSSFHEWAITDKVFRAAAMIAVPFIRLSVLHCCSQLDDEFFRHSLDSIGVIASRSSPLSASSSSNCTRHMSGFLGNG